MTIPLTQSRVLVLLLLQQSLLQTRLNLLFCATGGIILLPGINSGVTVRMIFVRFTGASDGTMYSGYIDPLTPDVFSLYDPYGSIVVNPPVEDRYTSGEYTTGLIKGLAGLEISGGGDISGGMDISGAVNINLDSGAATNIYGTAIDLSAASIDVSGAISNTFGTFAWICN